MSFGSIIHDMVIDMNETRLNAASQNGAPLGRTIDDPYTSRTPRSCPAAALRCPAVTVLDPVLSEVADYRITEVNRAMRD